MTDEERKQVEKILDKCICIQESGFVYPDCAFCNHAEAVLAIIKERDAWRAKYRSCAWCKGNVELADHSDDCPVKRCQRLEDERDELRDLCGKAGKWIDEEETCFSGAHDYPEEKKDCPTCAKRSTLVTALLEAGKEAP